MGEELWSGWGVRTMSTGDAGYNPLSYHNGTVWPHDNSLIAHGLARHARWPEAQRIVRRMLGAALALRLPAARGLRRPPARRDAVPDRLPDRRAAAGVGGRARRCCCCRCCSGSSPTGGAASSSHARARGAALVGRAARCASPGSAPSTASGTCASSTGTSPWRRHEASLAMPRPLVRRGTTGRCASAKVTHEDRDPEPAVVPGSADGLRRDRVDRLAARRRARRRRATR